jgi:hypothetical protein
MNRILWRSLLPVRIVQDFNFQSESESHSGTYPEEIAKTVGMSGCHKDARRVDSSSCTPYVCVANAARKCGHDTEANRKNLSALRLSDVPVFTRDPPIV